MSVLLLAMLITVSALASLELWRQRDARRITRQLTAAAEATEPRRIGSVYRTPATPSPDPPQPTPDERIYPYYPSCPLCGYARRCQHPWEDECSKWPTRHQVTIRSILCRPDDRVVLRVTGWWLWKRQRECAVGGTHAHRTCGVCEATWLAEAPRPSQTSLLDYAP